MNNILNRHRRLVYENPEMIKNFNPEHVKRILKDKTLAKIVLEYKLKEMI